MKLPNGEHAYIGDKLRTYALDPRHRLGAHKARVFAAALGITLSNEHDLADAIRDAAAQSEAATLVKQTQFGAAYSLEFSMRTSRGEALVLTGWIIRNGEDFPRLTTCYVV